MAASLKAAGQIEHHNRLQSLNAGAVAQGGVCASEGVRAGGDALEGTVTPC